jgi:hypothetical protein
LRKAADQDYARAQDSLGVMYEKGEGVPTDYAEALKWVRKAADQGLAEAQHNLGVMYEKGEGVPKDYAEALKWLRKAADQENADAQYALGVMYANGEGVPKDGIEGLAWFNLAADSGDENAVKNRPLLEQSLGESRVLAAQQISKKLRQEIEADNAAKASSPSASSGPPEGVGP